MSNVKKTNNLVIGNDILDLVDDEARDLIDELRSDVNDDLAGIETRIDNLVTDVTGGEVTNLWSGSINEVGDTATLSADVSGFDFIDIYMLSGIDTKFYRIPKTQTSLQIQSQNMSDNGSSNFLRLWETGISISSTTVSINKVIAWAWDDPNSGHPTVTANATNGDAITRIDGVKTSASVNAELADVRVGADGVTYGSAGAAVRGQISGIKNTVLTGVPISHNIDKDDDWSSYMASHYASSSGWVESNQYDSWYFTAESTGHVYLNTLGNASYLQLCVYPSGNFNDSNYVRYRSSDSNLPTESTPLTIGTGTLVIISATKNTTWSFVFNELNVYKLNPSVKLAETHISQVADSLNIGKYQLSYANGVLTITGNGIDCSFSDLDFNNGHGVFELQNLTYNNAVIFATNNDYLGPVRVHGESIKGAKHGGELTDSVRIFADGTELADGDSVSARTLSIYVESTISTDEFKRYTVWTLNRTALTVNTIITTLKNLQIDYVFGCGIISCQDDVNIAWLNKQKLTSDVLIGLNENTAIVTTGGTLVSKRISVNSEYGDHRIAFNVYSGRKKLYYYTCYGSNISVPNGTVFASCAELEFS